MPVDAIAVRDVVVTIDPIWGTKNETASRVLTRIRVPLAPEAVALLADQRLFEPPDHPAARRQRSERRALEDPPRRHGARHAEQLPRRDQRPHHEREVATVGTADVMGITEVARNAFSLLLGAAWAGREPTPSPETAARVCWMAARASTLPTTATRALPWSSRLNGATNATVKVSGVNEDTIRNIEN